MIILPLTPNTPAQMRDVPAMHIEFVQPKAVVQFLVRFRYDDRLGTIGTCRTDHHMERGEVIYGQHGRGTVTHCHSVTPVTSKVVPGAHGGLITTRA